MFGIVDYTVFLFTIIVSVSIGIFFAVRGKNNNTALNYFLGNRQFSPIPVALSFVVTFQSSLMMLGVPAETYTYGLKVILLSPGIMLSYIFAAVVVVPMFHPLQLTSIYKYFQLRFNSNSVRYLTAGAGSVYYIFYMAVITYGTALALEKIVKIPFWVSMIIYIVVTAIYTAIGGIKAVIWTDVFQVIIMMTGVIAILAKSMAYVGGMKEVWALGRERLELFDFRPDPTIRHSFWSLTLGSFTQFLYLTLTQASVQRINSTPTIRTARILFYISGPLYAIFFILISFQGVTIFAYYTKKGCDILASGTIDNLNLIIPYTVMELFHEYPGLTGLFIASLSSASLSSLSSCLSSLAAITYEDIIRVVKPSIEDSKATNMSKIVVLLYGAVALGFAFLISSIEGPISAIFACFMGSLDGPACSIFLLSFFFRRSTPLGICTGALCGMAFSMWLAMGQNFSTLPPPARLSPGDTDQCLAFSLSNVTTPPGLNISTAPEITQMELTGLQKFYSISYMYVSLFGALVAAVVGVLVSLLTKSQYNEPDEQYIFTVDKLWSKSRLRDIKDFDESMEAEVGALMPENEDKV